MAWGWRGGGWAGPWPGRGPFSYLPPWLRPGWLFGFGRGFCRCWWGYPYTPRFYAMSPWLPRWWAYPQYWYWPPYAGYAWPYIAYGWGFYGYPYWLPAAYAPYW